MLKIALYEPRIPQNTGNIARTCAAFNLELDLIEPLGFSLDDKYLKRAGLDYWPLVTINNYPNFDEFKSNNSSKHIISFSRHAKTTLYDIEYGQNDILLFGREDTGLPDNIKCQTYKTVTIPMPGGQHTPELMGVRSLNLSVSCAIGAFYALTKLGCLSE